MLNGLGNGSIILQNQNDSNYYYNNNLQIQYDSIITISGEFIPSITNTFSLGNTGSHWKELYIGPGSINIQGPIGSTTNATIGSDRSGIVYTEYGIASPFYNIGPYIGSDGAVGGWQIYSVVPGDISNNNSNFTMPTDLVARVNGPTGLTGPIYSLLGKTGSIGSTGPQGVSGPTGPQGNNGTSGGLVLFLVPDDSYNNIPDLSGNLLTSPTFETTPRVLQRSTSSTPFLLGSFYTQPNSLQSRIISPGVWDLNVWAYTNYSGNHLTNIYAKFYYTDSSGNNPVLILDGSKNDITITSTNIQQWTVSNYIPATTLPDLSYKILIQIYAVQMNGGSKTAYLYFNNDNTPTHIHTSLAIQGTPGPTGSTGPQGPQGTQGPQGSNGTSSYYSTTSLMNGPTNNANGTTFVNIFNGTTGITGSYYGSLYTDSYNINGTVTGPTGNHLVNAASGDIIFDLSANYIISSTGLYNVFGTLLFTVSSTTNNYINIRGIKTTGETTSIIYRSNTEGSYASNTDSSQYGQSIPFSFLYNFTAGDKIRFEFSCGVSSTNCMQGSTVNIYKLA